ncbi:MAG: InlB B-repeat-containing protein, partial [Actinomycetota bacterium]
MALVAVVLPAALGTMPEALAATPELVLGRPRVGEYQPVRGDGYLAWQQNSKKRPEHYDVYARPLDGGAKFKVNARKNNGANGDIDDGVLVYQQFQGDRSDIALFDLDARSRSEPPAGVNTRQWEYWPSLSGDQILFGRLYGNGMRRVFLFDVSSGTRTKLDELKGKDDFLAPGQVNGDYAVWYRCISERQCEVFRYRISEGSSEAIPGAGLQRTPSVAPDGTVYLVRSAPGCGNRVRLMRLPVQGPEEILTRLSSGRDIGTTRVSIAPDGEATVLYDNYDCDTAEESDAWEIVEGGAPDLTVRVEGDGEGMVTSSPSGINCGSDCSETYDRGTGVTLTATPQGDSAFGGWGGACTGTQTTCTVTMDGAKNVTATFTTDPVLSVSRAGTGTGVVSSSPSGINCGSDCNQPYPAGTTVTLSATAGTGSDFTGWSGACSGMTCTVTMNVSRSVTATFDLLPPTQFTLNVSLGGSGSGSVIGDGIACPGDCSAQYPDGTEVSLNASADAGSVFTGWSDACSGMTCSVTMNSDKSATASFDPIVPTLML